MKLTMVFGVELGHASEPDEPVKVWTLRQIMRISSHGMSFPGTIIRESILHRMITATT